MQEDQRHVHVAKGRPRRSQVADQLVEASLAKQLLVTSSSDSPYGQKSVPSLANGRPSSLPRPTFVEQARTLARSALSVTIDGDAPEYTRV
jgi:hypothetical protein